MASKRKVRPDPVDGLPASVVGQWAIDEKLLRLRRYIDAAHATRRRFIPPQGPGGATYIDPYCGPARIVVKDTDNFADGGCLTAVREAERTGSLFTDAFIGDVDAEFVAAAETRLSPFIKPRTFVGPAIETVARMYDQLPRYALHFAFLDPYALAPMPFSIIEGLARLNRIDLLIHVSLMDLQRELPKWRQRGNFEVLEAFAPGCTNHVDMNAPQEKVRLQVFHYWMDLVRGLKLDLAEYIPLVRGSKRQNLYWLVFAARNPHAHKLWAAISKIDPQQGFEF